VSGQAAPPAGRALGLAVHGHGLVVDGAHATRSDGTRAPTVGRGSTGNRGAYGIDEGLASRMAVRRRSRESKATSTQAASAAAASWRPMAKLSGA
jgi:hypothetical protein